MVNDATVVLADVPASNGVIHVIDKVLMPPADEPAVTEADGDICYNMVTHTVLPQAPRSKSAWHMHITKTTR